MNGIRMHDSVALLEGTQTRHFESGQPLLLHRGQVGTVVMIYDDGACEVEFADRTGRAYAMLTIRPEKLMVLLDTPEQAAA
jgi:hypothetical protein